MGKRNAIIVSALAVLAMCGFIFFMSASAGGDSGSLSMMVVQAIVGVIPGFGEMSEPSQLELIERLHFAVRKGAHFTEYAVLGVLVANLLAQIAAGRRRAHDAGLTRSAGAGAPPSGHAGRGALVGLAARQVAASWALASLYAVTDELHQLFVPGRVGAIGDVCIDSAGALAGALLFSLALLAVRRRRRGI